MRPAREDDLGRGPDPAGPWEPGDDDGPTVPDATRGARVLRAREALERLGQELQDATQTLEEVIEELPDGPAAPPEARPDGDGR